MSVQKELRELNGLNLLTTLIRGEGARQPLVGQVAIAWVVKNRRQDSRWPNSYRDVILQEGQFSCFNDNNFRPEILTHRWNETWWRQIRWAAGGVYYGYLLDPTNGATNYFNPKLISKPRYYGKAEPTLIIGDHEFYKL